MNLAIVISRYHRGAGLERVAVEYARGLRARGHDITVFARDVTVEADDEPIRFTHVPAPGQIALRAATFPLAASRAVARAEPFDNIIAFGSVMTMPAVVRAPGVHRSWFEFANREWPVGSVAGVKRRLNPHHRIVLGWDRYVLGGGRARAVLAAGAWQADDIRRFYPKVADRVQVLADGVNLDEFAFDAEVRARRRANWGVGDVPVVLAVVTEIRRKGIGGLFDAFAHILRREPRARLVVASTAPADQVRALAHQAGVTEALGPVGFVPDMRAAYAASDLLLFPTRFDTWGLPVVEALACGTPVVVSARAGAATVVRPGESGAVVIDPTDPHAVAEAALEVLARRWDRDALRAAVEHLSWDRIVGQLDAIVEATAS